MSGNPFKGKGSLVLRKLLENPKKQWAGKELATELNLSSAWVNRVVGTLEFEKFIERSGAGPQDTIYLKYPKKLIEKWVQSYHFDFNKIFLYLKLKDDPVKTLAKLSESLKFNYAVTGYRAANLIKKTTVDEIPMVYLWPSSNQSSDFKPLLMKLENIHSFLPVTKGANLILLKPYLKDVVFFGSHAIRNTHTVSPLQLYLDLSTLDRGKYIIDELEPFWKKKGMDYVI